MKRYKINNAEEVNTKASATGIKWRFGGSVDDYSETVNRFENNIEWYKMKKANGHTTQLGLRITDTETNTVVYERMI